MDEHRPIPRVVKAMAVVIAIGLVLVVWMATRIVQADEQRRQDQCTVAAQARDDYRSMWLVTFAESPGNVTVERLHGWLDETLPPFTCSPSGERITKETITP